MNHPDVKKLIIKAQNGDSASVVDLVQRFQPLMRKYSAMLNYEDAFYELQFVFIKAILKTPDVIGKFPNAYATIAYLHKCIVSEYMRLQRNLQKKRNEVNLTQLTDTQLTDFENSLRYEDDYSDIEFGFIRNRLTEKEFEVIYRHYYLCQSIASIADHFSVARQNINKTKKRALDKLLVAYQV